MTTNTKATPENIIATAVELVARRRSELDQAQTSERNLRAKLGHGDDSITTDDLLRAGADIERARLLFNASVDNERKARAEASRLMAQADPKLAELVAALVSENLPKLGLRGVTVHVVDALPAEAPDILPAVFVYQAQAAVRDRLGGTESGNCILAVVFDESDRIDVRGVQQTLKTLADDDNRLVLLTANNNRPTQKLGDHARMIALTVEVRGFKPELPIIESPFQPHNLRYLSQHIASDVKESLSRFDERAPQFSQVQASAPEIISQKTANGVLRTVVEVSVLGTLPASWRIPGQEIGEAVERSVLGQQSAFVNGLGRVESVELVNVEPATGGRRITARLGFQTATI